MNPLHLLLAALALIPNCFAYAEDFSENEKSKCESILENFKSDQTNQTTSIYISNIQFHQNFRSLDLMKIQNEIDTLKAKRLTNIPSLRTQSDAIKTNLTEKFKNPKYSNA